MINDPYEVLGVRRNASEKEIKQAYRELVKKYHPDKYQGNPLADLAEEKLQQVNEAYDMLTKDGPAASGSPYGGAYDSAAGGAAYSGGAQYGGAYGSAYGGGNPEYAQIRAALARRDNAAAYEMLIHAENRDAEWFFLSGVLSYNQGQVRDGIANVQQAINMDPENPEYRDALQQMSTLGGIYRQRSDAYGYNENGSMDAGALAGCSALPVCLCC